MKFLHSLFVFVALSLMFLFFMNFSRKHTHVFDDDSDYFCSTNPWLTLEERDEVRKREEEFFNKKNESRRDKKITLKLEGKLIVFTK